MSTTRYLERARNEEPIDCFTDVLEPATGRQWHSHPQALNPGRAIEPLRCPHCNSVIYTRKSELCGVCFKRLPEELLFTPHEAARVQSTIRTEQQKHRLWMQR